ncbi:MAG TPA: hypothetical protein V6C96_05105, partial [Vampirovibrionales bacterium]
NIASAQEDLSKIEKKDTVKVQLLKEAIKSCSSALKLSGNDEIKDLQIVKLQLQLARLHNKLAEYEKQGEHILRSLEIYKDLLSEAKLSNIQDRTKQEILQDLNPTLLQVENATNDWLPEKTKLQMKKLASGLIKSSVNLQLVN